MLVASALVLSMGFTTLHSMSWPMVSGGAGALPLVARARSSMAAPPEVQAAFSLVMLLSVTHPLLPSPKKREPSAARMQPSRRKPSPRASKLKLCEGAESPPGDAAESPASDASVRAYDQAEEKALRKIRLGFGGYPAGPYFTAKESSGPEAAYALARQDHPILSGWSDEEIKGTVGSLKPTVKEIFVETPIGPFIVLSSFAIWRDGMAPWGIPPCREYLDICAALPTFQPFAQ